MSRSTRPTRGPRWARDLDAATEILGQAVRSGTVAARADAIDQAAELFGDSVFDPAETYDAAEAWGLPVGAVDAAAHIAVTLRQVESGRE